MEQKVPTVRQSKRQKPFYFSQFFQRTSRIKKRNTQLAEKKEEQQLEKEFTQMMDVENIQRQRQKQRQPPPQNQQQQQQQAPQQPQQQFNGQNRIPQHANNGGGGGDGPNQSNMHNVNPQRFLQKIPNRKVMREFLVRSGYYTLRLRDLTAKFCKQLFKGQKKLMKQAEVNFIDQVPNWQELSTKKIWSDVKQSHPEVLVYFPDYTPKQQPPRSYLLNVVNTIKKDSILHAVEQVRQKRDAKVTGDAPIMMNEEIFLLYQQFQSISTDQTVGGLSGMKDLNQCPLCLSFIKKKNAQTTFDCKKHFVHIKCFNNYMKKVDSNFQYACPMKCPKN